MKKVSINEIWKIVTQPAYRAVSAHILSLIEIESFNFNVGRGSYKHLLKLKLLRIKFSRELLQIHSNIIFMSLLYILCSCAYLRRYLKCTFKNFLTYFCVLIMNVKFNIHVTSINILKKKNIFSAN